MSIHSETHIRESALRILSLCLPLISDGQKKSLNRVKQTWRCYQSLKKPELLFWQISCRQNTIEMHEAKVSLLDTSESNCQKNLYKTGSRISSRIYIDILDSPDQVILLLITKY